MQDIVRLLLSKVDAERFVRERGLAGGATLKLAQLLVQHGDFERGRGLLVTWIERDARDAEPLYMLCDMDESIEHWDGVAAAATRLAYVTEGEAQVTAALRSS